MDRKRTVDKLISSRKSLSLRRKFTQTTLRKDYGYAKQIKTGISSSN